MKKVIVKALIKSEDGWRAVEEFNVDADNPIEEVRNILTRFNNSLRPNETKRSLLVCRVLNKPGVTHHEWDKTNLTTISKGGRTYDTAKCKICGVTGKRFGLSPHVMRDKKFEPDKYANCNWFIYR